MTHEEKKAILKSVIDERGDLVKHEDRELIDMHFVDYTDYDEFIIRVNIPDWQRNPAGTLHGGMVCYYMDTAAGVLSAVECGDLVSTMDLKINFIRGIAREIDHIFVKAKVISIGRRVIVAHAEVRDPDNWLMASGTANCMRLMPADENPTIVES